MEPSVQNPSTRNCWVVVPVGLLVLLSLGSVYSWSVFRAPLERELGLFATQSLLPYTCSLIFYAALMPVAGFFIERVGARKLIWIGAILVAAGYAAAGFSHGPMSLALGFGALAGAGVGIGYGVPLAVSARWFPNAKGLAIGVTVIGFGISPLITAPLANLLIEAFGVRPALIVAGLGIFLTILICSIWMRFPDATGPGPGTRKTPSTGEKSKSIVSSLLNKRAFYGLRLCYAFGAFIGLSAIGISVSVGMELFALEPATAAAFVSLFAIFNGGSRPLFG